MNRPIQAALGTTPMTRVIPFLLTTAAWGAEDADDRGKA